MRLARFAVLSRAESSSRSPSLAAGGWSARSTLEPGATRVALREILHRADDTRRAGGLLDERADVPSARRRANGSSTRPRCRRSGERSTSRYAPRCSAAPACSVQLHGPAPLASRAAAHRRGPRPSSASADRDLADAHIDAAACAHANQPSPPRAPTAGGLLDAPRQAQQPDARLERARLPRRDALRVTPPPWPSPTRNAGPRKANGPRACGGRARYRVRDSNPCYRRERPAS